MPTAALPIPYLDERGRGFIEHVSIVERHRGKPLLILSWSAQP
jgi:hypothetical protein